MRVLTHSLHGRSWLVVLALFAVSCSTPSSSAPAADRPTTTAITDKEVEDAQKAWCKGLVDIATASQQTYVKVANEFIDRAYDFNGNGRVFFRPTLAYTPHAFRTDRPGTLSYFIGGNSTYPDGGGFARGPWVDCKPSNDLPNGVKGIQTYGDIAVAMGTVTLTDCDGKPTVADKVFVFRKETKEPYALKLVFHMSAKANTPSPMPTPCKKQTE